MAEHRDLTELQLQLIRMSADGKSSRDIAESLGISASSVRSRLALTYKKLEAHSLGQAVARCYESGLFVPKGYSADPRIARLEAEVERLGRELKLERGRKLGTRLEIATQLVEDAYQVFVQFQTDEARALVQTTLSRVRELKADLPKSNRLS